MKSHVFTVLTTCAGWEGVLKIRSSRFFIDFARFPPNISLISTIKIQSGTLVEWCQVTNRKSLTFKPEEELKSEISLHLKQIVVSHYFIKYA